MPWPKTNKGYKKTDNGQLPLDHPEPAFQANINHWINTLVSELYCLAAANKSDCKMTRGDAERLKHYIKIVVHTTRHTNDPSLMKKRLENCVNHHFNIHADCGVWCPALKWSTDVAK